jgi:CRP/FNR family cyclic AMP-dependent transcriptional regulator
MTESSTLGAFASHPFLSGLDNRLLMQLASGVGPFSASPGEYLGREGELASSFFLIQSGKVAIESRRADGAPSPIDTVGPGEVIGWSWLLPPYRWQFDCHAVDAVHGLALNADWLRWQCEQNHELGYHLLKHLLAVVGSRLAATRRQLGEKTTR